MRGGRGIRGRGRGRLDGVCLDGGVWVRITMLRGVVLVGYMDECGG